MPIALQGFIQTSPYSYSIQWHHSFHSARSDVSQYRPPGAASFQSLGGAQNIQGVRKHVEQAVNFSQDLIACTESAPEAVCEAFSNDREKDGCLEVTTERHAKGHNYSLQHGDKPVKSGKKYSDPPVSELAKQFTMALFHEVSLLMGVSLLFKAARTTPSSVLTVRMLTIRPGFRASNKSNASERRRSFPPACPRFECQTYPSEAPATSNL